MIKMRKIFRFILPGFVFLLLLLSACNFQTARAPSEPLSPDAAFTQAAQTIIAGITQTAVAEAATAALTQQPAPEQPEPEQAEEVVVQEAPTITLSPTTEQQEAEAPLPSDTPTATTEGLPTISANVSTNCRYGPDPVFKILGYLLEGETSEVHGKDKYGYWWYIANPDVPGGFCWVWTETTVVEGDTSALPYIEPPPTPTPTPTDTPTATPTVTSTTDGSP
jgi:hypothetical protein